VRKVPAKRADEYDSTSRYWKRYLGWKPGERKAIKTRMNQRDRHAAKQALREGKEL
jgi:hypothetical protein